MKHINLGAEIKGLIRTDAYEIPTEAVREAIVFQPEKYDDIKIQITASKEMEKNDFLIKILKKDIIMV